RSKTWRSMSLSRNRSWRARGKAEWSGTLSSLEGTQNQRKAKVTRTTRHKARSAGVAKTEPRTNNPHNTSAPNQRRPDLVGKGARSGGRRAPAPSAPRKDKEWLQSLGRDDRQAPPLRGKMNRKTVSGRD